MPDTWRGAGDVVPICPDCQSVLDFVGSWTFRGLWGFNEVHTYECRTHGTVFIGSETPTAVGPDKGPTKRQMTETATR